MCVVCYVSVVCYVRVRRAFCPSRLVRGCVVCEVWVCRV